MRLPPKKKPGDPVLAADWNLLLDAVAARTPCPGTGIELVASSGGFAYRVVPRSSAGGTSKPPPFSLLSLKRVGEEGEQVQVTIKEGWVIERLPSAEGAPVVGFHMPQFGQDALDKTPRPILTLTPGQTVYCRIATDPRGAITGTPEITIGGDDEKGTHHVPESPDSDGVAGDYWVKLLTVKAEGDKLVVEVFQQSDIEHWATLWTGVNRGDGAGIYKEYSAAAGEYRFRSIKGAYAVNAEESAETVDLEFAAKNTEGEGVAVYKDEDEDDGEGDGEGGEGGNGNGEGGGNGAGEVTPAVFRKIKGAETLGGDTQIQVQLDGDDSILVRGNGNEGSIQIEDEGELLSWKDGLITGGRAAPLLARTYKVCVDGEVKEVTFLVLNEEGGGNGGGY